MRESKRRYAAGQARDEARNSASIKTVDDARGSRENSKCARMDRKWNSGIPRGQDETFHGLNSSACSRHSSGLFNSGLLCCVIGALQRHADAGESCKCEKVRRIERDCRRLSLQRPWCGVHESAAPGRRTKTFRAGPGIRREVCGGPPEPGCLSACPAKAGGRARGTGRSGATAPEGRLRVVQPRTCLQGPRRDGERRRRFSTRSHPR